MNDVTAEKEDAAMDAQDAARRANIIATAPERIFIQQGEEGEKFETGEEVTWCTEQVDDDDVQYVRADLFEALKAEVESMRKGQQTDLLASNPAVVESASPYDKAVAALAPYLPDGWVAQSDDHDVSYSRERPEFVEQLDGFSYWACPSGWDNLSRLLNMPKAELSRGYCKASLRRILNGAAAPSNGQEP